jgi:hypothetical protein
MKFSITIMPLEAIPASLFSVPCSTSMTVDTDAEGMIMKTEQSLQ